MKASWVFAIGLSAIVGGGPAFAQNNGYTITTPGQPPTFVNPNIGGGYTEITPGRSPTFINPNMGGGFTVITPGQPPSFIRPNIPSLHLAPNFGSYSGSHFSGDDQGEDDQ